ncbi:MAG TPA: HAMP domain-containing sensor histidine kinase [Pyrinomonadaceae bacterium]|nr:HAMP domain-containing sensor histidine kinase [Pyrinomonadaceae bacterium]
MQKRPLSLSVRNSVARTSVEDIEPQTSEEERNQLLALQQNGSASAQGLTKRVFALYQAERKARKDAEECNRIKDEFLAALSHELRTPLTAILGWSQVLRQVKPGESAFTRGLDTIDRSARAQEQLIEDLLDVMRIKTGKLRLQVAPVELSSVIDSAIDTLQPLADSKHIRMQLISASKTAGVLGDQTRLQQVIWNLLSNAIKFTPRGGSVLIQLERVDSHMEVRVTDTGDGISPDFLPHVFEPYRQRDGSTRCQGLGLGLAIVRHLVELHSGIVRAESSGKGEGSCFTVKLPLMAAKTTALQQQMPNDGSRQEVTAGSVNSRAGALERRRMGHGSR